MDDVAWDSSELSSAAPVNITGSFLDEECSTYDCDNACPANLSDNMHSFIHPTGESDRSDSIFQRVWWDNDPVVLKSHKLLFFTVPKNSCTEWKRLFRRMMNHSNWAKKSPHDPAQNGLKYLGSFSRSKQEEFMTSPDWTRAIFVRDPMQRLLSAFLDKAYGRERYIHRRCCKKTPRTNSTESYKKQCELLRSLKQKRKLPTPAEFPFKTFVQEFMVQFQDDHWKPQSQRMKYGNWQFINFIGYFDTLERDARCLLERIGAWEEYGANGWGNYGNESFLHGNRAVHATGAGDHFEEYFTPDLMQDVLTYLQPDYDHPLFNFTRPDVAIEKSNR